ncbi:MAG: serine phosphatase RsbU (regulator of sigma subunit) [Planctomycetota bacterium]|jgi:serine phosphatase RsbU (regulator of sigma subunit)
MIAISTKSPWASAESLVSLHACRTQGDLEGEFKKGLATMLPGIDTALCLAQSVDGEFEVRFVIGDGTPLQPLQLVTRESWSLPDAQRLSLIFKGNLVGELWLAAEPAAEVVAELQKALTHIAAAMVNLALNFESREATDEYCATLQALEEGIVLFQEPDPEALMARLLSLASGMVNAMAGALYVLDEIGNPNSELTLQQSSGMPEQLLASFRGADDSPWPLSLIDSAAQVATRDEAGSIAGLADDCAPDVLQEIVILPLRYHGVQAGLCLLFNPRTEAAQAREYIGRLVSFGQLAAALLHRLHLERLKESSISIGRELQIAETIQKRLVPSEAPPNENYEFAWQSIAAKSIGGDYVDFVTSDIGEICAIVADASGHGINSALLMSSFRANYRGHASWLEPSELTVSLNNEVVHEVGPTGMFITAVLIRIEPESNEMTLCSAGHNPTMLYRAATGKVEQIDSHGPPLGFMADAEYEGYSGSLQPGDVLLLYTDGITEATDAELEMFGEERLERLLCAHGESGTAQQVLDATLAELAAFTNQEHHEDDVSLMVIKAR